MRRAEEGVGAGAGESREQRGAGVVSRVRLMRRPFRRAMGTETGEDVGTTPVFRQGGTSAEAGAEARRGSGLAAAAAVLDAMVLAAKAPHPCTIGLIEKSESRTQEYGPRRSRSSAITSTASTVRHASLGAVARASHTPTASGAPVRRKRNMPAHHCTRDDQRHRISPHG